MSNSINVEALKDRVDIAEVISRYVPSLKKSGPEFKGLCPFHDEKSASFSVIPNKQMFYCFGCGAGGDVIDFVTQYTGCSFHDAVEAIGGADLQTDEQPIRRQSLRVDPYEAYTPVHTNNRITLGDTIKLINPKRDGNIWTCKPLAVYDYHGQGYVIRNEIDGKKLTPTVRWCKGPQGEGWHSYPFEEGGRAMYGIERIQDGTTQVLIVEGEKCADAGYLAAAKRLPVVSWSGGTNNADKTDWTPLAGMSIIYWPDNDDPGFKCAVDMALMLREIGIKSLKVVNAPRHLNPKGWDCADKEWSSPGELFDYCRQHADLQFDNSEQKAPISEQKATITRENLDSVNQNAELTRNGGPGPGGCAMCQEPLTESDVEYFGNTCEACQGKLDYNGEREEPPLEHYQDDFQDEPVHSDFGQGPASDNSGPVPADDATAGPKSTEGDDTDSQASQVTGDMPFRVLGHYRGSRYYLPHATQQIIELSPSHHTKNNLLALAPMDKWLQMDWDIASKAGLDAAVNGLLQISAQAGLFNGDRLRGRGAWLDEGRAVVHLGQHLYVDGQPMAPEDIKSKFIYQQDINLGVTLAVPANNGEANQIIKICERLSWENKLSATLAAGWCVVAPLTGILPWRPHIWVTGPSGAGKSTVLKSIIAVMMGDIALIVEGKTTEAGIRQQLGTDARPVIFDEAEAEDKHSADRLKGIMDFARVCSSGGTIVKGTANGSSISFTARTAFCFSSINTSIKHFADESRISQLVLKRDTVNSTEYYEQLELDILNTITPDYGDAMFSRSVQHMETLQANCTTFIQAANIHFKSRRIADQVGVLLAGAYLCYSTKLIDRAEALEWIQAQNWEDHTAVASKSDSERLLSYILTQKLRVMTNDKPLDLTIGEAALVAAQVNSMSPYDSQAGYCFDELKRLGIEVEHSRILIANNSDPIRKLLADTPWSSSWARPLSELEGAEKVANMYFTAGIKSRAVALPVSLFDER